LDSCSSISIQKSVQETPLILHGKRHLVGTLTYADDSAPNHIVLLLHGWAGTGIGPHRLLVRIARKAAEMGGVGLRFDFSGRGESEGDPLMLTVDDLIDDSVYVKEWLQQKYPSTPISVCGICSGSNIAIGLATVSHIDKLVLMSALPFTETRSQRKGNKFIAMLKIYLRKAFHISTWKRLLKGEINTKGVKSAIINSSKESLQALKISRRDIFSDFKKLTIPCLFLYGSADPEADQAWSVYEPLMRNNANIKYQFIDGADHNFSTTVWSRMVEESLLEFIHS